jgi:DNA repair protein RecO (recombination protein O)
MSWIESDAVVLRHVKQGDTSRVVTLLARSGGKVAVLAKGSRKPGSRFGAGLDLFNVSHVRYRPRPHRDLVFLDACELRRSFAGLSRDLHGFAAAGVCAELTDRLVPDGAEAHDVYDLLVEAIAVLAEIAPLSEGQEMRAVALPVVFQMRLMDQLGIAPELTACTACGSADLEGSSSLSARRGGLLCPRCRAAEGGRRLGAETVAFLRASLMGELAGVAVAPDPPRRALVMESRAALDAVLEYHHGHRVALRSRRFLDDLGGK